MFESPTNLLILGPVTGVCTAVALWWGRVWLAVQFALCYGLARFLPGFGWSLWDRARPDFVAEGVAAPAAHAFPSGHALFALTTYGLLAYLWASRSGSWVERVLAFGVLGVLAAVVGYGRLLLGAHWPSDLIGAWVIGAVWLAGNVLVLRWVEVKGRKLIVGSDK
jgi:undecaprenyl-diphosphatase